MGDAEKTVTEMMNPEAQLPEVYAFAGDLYQRELATLQQQSPEVSTTFSLLEVGTDHQLYLVCFVKCIIWNKPVLSLHRTALMFSLF